MRKVTEKLRVLVVEDESLVAMMIEDVLADLGHDVVAVAGRLPAALREAAGADIDFAVLDLNLDCERTDAVAAALHARGVPFIFVTGYGAAGVAEQWRHVPVVTKPFQPKDITAAIADALRR